MGWRVAGNWPDLPRFVVVVAPHTSNWDFVVGFAAYLALEIDASWLGKHTLFRWPWGGFMRFLGGVAIDRSAPQGSVKAVADLLTAANQLVVAVPPSGTRSKRDHWKSGFYWIAHTAQVPIVCGYLDYSKRRAGLGNVFVPTGDVVSDMERIRAFYADKRGKFPDNESTILLREEEEGGSAPGANLGE